MKKILIIKADINDGDYIYAIQNFTDSEHSREILTHIGKVLKENSLKYSPNWDEDAKAGYIEDGLLASLEVEFFDDYYRPFGHDSSVHSIDSIRILTVTDDEELL